jgi:hypothetical protein
VQQGSRRTSKNQQSADVDRISGGSGYEQWLNPDFAEKQAKKRKELREFIDQTRKDKTFNLQHAEVYWRHFGPTLLEACPPPPSARRRGVHGHREGQHREKFK